MGLISTYILKHRKITEKFRGKKNSPLKKKILKIFIKQ